MSSRAATLLPLLSTREKVGQLNQRLLGWRAVRRAPGSGFEVTEETLEEIETHGGLGALYGTFRADAWSGRHWGNGIRPEERAEVADLVQRTVAEHSPHGIGVLLSEEAPHGHQALGGTLLPTHHTSAASWDPDLVQEAYRAVGAELAASGVHLALVSALDMLRDPRWGRSEESFGEDPHLASVLTEALVTGMQAEGVAAVLKHLAAQGEGIGGRNGHSAPIGPNDLAEIHLPPVLAGLQAGALGFMAAYNDIDAVPCCANPWLLQEFLRDQHGFDGLVMADMGAIDRLAEMTGDLSSAGRAALLAGVDLSLCDRSYVDLGALAEEDPQVMTALDASCLRVLEMKDRFGLLGPTGEDGATDGSVGPGHPGVDPVDLAPLQAATARASRELAAASLVLLSNESAGGDGSADTSPAPVLPLDAASLKHLAVVGPFADDVPCMLGDYVPPLPDGSARSIGRALADTLPQAEVMVDGVATPEWLTGVESPLTGADAVVVVLGGTSHRSFEDEFADNGAIAGAAGQATNGEGVDRADISLPLLHRPGQDPVDQDDLIRRVRQTTPVGVPVIAVVVAGRPHVITEVLDQADSVLWAGYPGPFGGDVVADALLGRAELTGRLPFTLPRASGVVPVRYNDHQSARGVYQDQTDPVLLPFGHGLRYTEVTAEQVQVAELAEEDSDLGEFVRISARFRNPSDRTTRVTEPVFVHRRGGTHVPRQRELVGHLATRLDAGEEQEASIHVAAGVVFVRGAAVGAARTRIEVAGESVDLTR